MFTCSSLCICDFLMFAHFSVYLPDFTKRKYKKSQFLSVINWCKRFNSARHRHRLQQNWSSNSQLTSPCTAPPGDGRSVVRRLHWSRPFWVELRPGSDVAAWQRQPPPQTLRSDGMKVWADSWLCSPVPPRRRWSMMKEAEPGGPLTLTLWPRRAPPLPECPSAAGGYEVGVWVRSSWWGPCGALRDEEFSWIRTDWFSDSPSFLQTDFYEHACC